MFLDFLLFWGHSHLSDLPSSHRCAEIACFIKREIYPSSPSKTENTSGDLSCFPYKAVTSKVVEHPFPLITPIHSVRHFMLLLSSPRMSGSPRTDGFCGVCVFLYLAFLENLALCHQCAPLTSKPECSSLRCVPLSQ